MSFPQPQPARALGEDPCSLPRRESLPDALAELCVQEPGSLGSRGVASAPGKGIGAMKLQDWSCVHAGLCVQCTCVCWYTDVLSGHACAPVSVSV